MSVALTREQIQAVAQGKPFGAVTCNVCRRPVRLTAAWSRYGTLTIESRCTACYAYEMVRFTDAELAAILGADVVPERRV